MNIKIKFLPYERLKEMDIPHLLEDMKKDTIILIDAKLSVSQETAIIEETMKAISDKFSGIELSSMEINADEETSMLEKIRGRFAELILGKRRGITVIGPSKTIKKIKKNPKDLFLEMSG